MKTITHSLRHSTVLLSFWTILLIAPFKVSYGQQTSNLIDSLKNAPPDTNKVWLLIDLGNLYFFTKPDSCLIFVNQAIELSRKLNFTIGELGALNDAGGSLRLLGEFPQSLDMHFKALQINKRRGDKKGEAGTLTHIGFTYAELNEYRQALNYQHQANRLYDNLAVSHMSVFNLSNTGYTYEKMNMLDSALFFQQQAQTKYPDLKVTNGNLKQLILTRLGVIDTRLGKHEQALQYYREALQVVYSIKDKVNPGIIQTRIAESYKAIHQKDSSLYYARLGFINSRKVSRKLPILDACNLLVSLFRQENMPDSVIYYQDIAIAMNDSLYGPKKLRQLQVLTLKEQQQQQELVQEQERFKNKALWVVLGFFLIIAILLWLNNRQKQKVNAILETQKAEIQKTLTLLEATQTQLIEKEKLATLGALRLQELDAVKTKLYTNITHEFRTPLTVILGMAQQILEKPKEYVQEASKMITRNGQNLLNLINEMLDLSKLESGKLSLYYQQGDVVNFLKYIVESFHSFGESKGVKIHFISNLKAFIIDFDEARLQQVVSNLLSNALKFTPKGGDIYVLIATQHITNDTENTKFSLKIKDTGVGIEAANLPYIFDRFYQVDDSLTRHEEGTGIGLALTYELVKLMEGTITVKSYPNKGTEFEVTLPIRHVADLKIAKHVTEQLHITKPEIAILSDENQAVIGSENSTIVLSEGIPMKMDSYGEKPIVLIADDNADVRAYIAACLATDYTLIIAKDGQECENMAFNTTPDLIVLDVMMPFKDGFEVCKTLKNDERTSHIPIILLTAKADMDSKLQGLERGADAYLMKPFHKEELLLRIRKLLELRQQLQQHYLAAAVLTVEQQNPDASETEGGNNHSEEIHKVKNKLIINNLEHVFVLKVRKTIETHLTDSEFDVEKLCRILTLSYVQVHRKLSALTGLSANNFMRYIRLIKAKELLLNSNYTITAIAYDSGFNDHNYFIRVFKQEFGVTPQVWREQNVA